MNSEEFFLLNFEPTRFYFLFVSSHGHHVVLRHIFNRQKLFSVNTFNVIRHILMHDVLYFVALRNLFYKIRRRRRFDDFVLSIVIKMRDLIRSELVLITSKAK